MPTAKSDIYAWGLVFLECLLGEPVIFGDTVAQIFQRQLDPAEISIPAAIVESPLGALLRSVLRKNAASRRGDPVALHEELRRLHVAGLVGAIETHRRMSSRAPRESADTGSPNSGVLVRAQRRQVTVLCGGVDLRGPAPSDREQESLEKLMQDLKRSSQEIVERHGGWVAGSLAGRMLVYFGLSPRERQRHSSSRARRSRDCRACTCAIGRLPGHRRASAIPLGRPHRAGDGGGRRARGWNHAESSAVAERSWASWRCSRESSDREPAHESHRLRARRVRNGGAMPRTGVCDRRERSRRVSDSGISGPLRRS